MADILMTHSYHLPYDRKQLRKMQPYPPLATLYATAVLRQMGFSVAVFDTMLEDPTQGFPRALAIHRPKIVVVYEDDFNFLTKMCLTRMREVAWQIAVQAHEVNAITVVHGSDATDHAQDFLMAGFDYVLMGESELKLAELCDHLLCKKQIPQKVIHESARHSQSPHVAMPFPARDDIEIERYRELWKREHGRFSLNLISSRGCPFRCNWCAKPIFGDAFAVRNAGEVADEVKTLVMRYGAEHLWFADDVFALNRHWVQEFASAVKDRDCVVPFKIQSRADLMTEATVAALSRAGCEEVWMGVESGSQKVLDTMDKGLRVDEIVAAREHLRAHSIEACYFLQFGYPGETWNDILATVELVRETQPDDVGISFSYPLPGTGFHRRVREQMGAKHNWRDSDDLCVMFKGAYTDTFYRAIRDALHMEVNGWSGKGNRLSATEVARIWQDIESRERSSRNADVTVLTPRANPSMFPKENFVSLAQFLATGVNFV